MIFVWKWSPGAYGLVGPNGSGKTTLINLLTGQLKPTLGGLKVFGQDPWKDRRLLRRIGLCPATDVLYPNVSAKQWVSYLVSLHGFDAAESERLAVESLEIVGMESRMNRPMGEYSLGMRQRAKIAQSIAHQPDLIILDEPYNGLDPVGRQQMTRVLKDWVSRGKSLLFASHVLHEIEAITSFSIGLWWPFTGVRDECSIRKFCCGSTSGSDSAGEGGVDTYGTRSAGLGGFPCN